MNSYPHEFLAHPQPLMFVAGLTPSAQAGPSSRRNSINYPTSNTGGRSRSNSALPPIHPSASLTTPVVSPSPTASTVLPPISPPPNPILPSVALEASQELDSASKDPRDVEFNDLLRDLREAIGAMSGKGKAWLPDKERRDFRILLVDKGIRLPMRKVNPPSTTSGDPYAPAPTMHSPLSPLTPTSPLYPDGLIAPIWIRKHAELVPSVFVLFLRLYESPIHDVVEEMTAEAARARDEDERRKEKENDELLVKEIGERRKKLGERGIKLTVVLIASAATLDSPALDPRLSYLRRASALSSKASLFVLTPVPAAQLPDFVQSLQDALYDSAMEYYGKHAQHVRRKRARLPVNQLGSSVLSLPPLGGGPRALGSQGWAVRYDWKMGWFAQIRGEYDAARRHYEDCWNELARMFSSTTTLPPRTKRWAEAKVLADCVAINICKLLLYDNDATKVLGPFFVHLKKFGDLSRGWGIGEETFEFWSWIARQYRIFAELLEVGMQAGLHIPPADIPTFPTAQTATTPSPEYLLTPNSALNPLHILHQPGYYYYTAACCTIERKKRFEEALEMERDALASESGASSGYVSTAPGFANEKKVDHPGLIVELFTKAYSLFKDQNYAHSRVSLYVAFRIAETYCAAGQYDMAMRFFDRISTSFKREKWQPIVKEIRRSWYTCAQQMGDVETAVRLLIEMMGSNSGVPVEEKAGLQEDLLLLLQTTSPSSITPLEIQVESDCALLNIQAGFWQSEAVVSSEVPFQIVFTSPPDVDISNIAFSDMQITFSDGRQICVKSSAEKTEAVMDVGLFEGSREVEAGLKWDLKGQLICSGLIQSDIETEIRITSVLLSLKQNSWDVRLSFTPAEIAQWETSGKGFTPLQPISSSLLFQLRPHLVTFDIQHRDQALVGESFAIDLEICNADDRALEVEISVFLQPGEEDDTSTIQLESQESKTLISNFPLGSIAPSSKILKTIYLRSPTPIEKVLDLSIISTLPIDRPTGPFVENSHKEVDLSDDENLNQRKEEVNRTIVVPVVAPFSCASQVNCRAIGSTKNQSDAERQIGEAVVSTLLRFEAAGQVEIQSMEMVGENDDEWRLTGCSLEAKPSFPMLWSIEDSFSIVSRLALFSEKQRSTNHSASSSPAFLRLTWRPILPNTSASTSVLSSDPTEDGPKTIETITTILPLPPLSLPLPIESFITVRLIPPATVNLHQPFLLKIEILNTHPTHSHAGMALQLDTSENFVWTGNRVSRLPVLEAGAVLQTEIAGVAVGSVGWVDLMGIRVWEGGDDRKEVRIGDGERGMQVLVRP